MAKDKKSDKSAPLGGVLGGLIKKAAPSSSKAKEEKPRINLPDLDMAVDGFIKAAEDFKDAEGRKEQFKGIIAKSIEGEHKKACRDGSGYKGSVKLNDKLLCYVQYNELHQTVVKGAGEETAAKVNEVLDEAKKAFGDEVDRFFSTKYSIALKKEGQDDETLRKIIEAVGGPERFNELFAINVTLFTTKELHERRFIDADVDKKAKVLETMGFVKKYSPSLKPD
jgi:uncharacterized protein YjbJ (UPF0337 family)